MSQQPSDPEIQAYSTVLTPDILERVARVLNVRWPDWYRRLVVTLLERPPTHGDWLAGGFLYYRPSLIYRDTMDYRTGMLQLFRENPAMFALEPIAWPASFVVVGHYGDGSVIVDTTVDDQILHNVYKETYSLRPFINVRDAAESPEAFARTLLKAE